MLLLITSFLSSCADEFIETEPTTALDAGSLITDLATAQAAVNGLYDRFQQDYIAGGYNAYMPGLFSDELRHSGSFPSLAEFGANDISLNNVNNTSFWTDHYETINAANIIIDKLEVVEIDADAAARFDAQAKAVRAYLYFNLVRLYGGVPLSLTGNLSANEIDANPLPRASVTEVYTQILSDLDDALAGITTSGNIFFFNENAVRVLKAKVEMTRGMYAQAEATLEPVIGDKTLAGNYADLFTGTANTQEAILAIDYADFDGNGYAFFYLRAGGRYEVAPSAQLLGAFEEGDSRTSQIRAFGTEAAKQVGKFKDPGSGSDDAYIYRYADALLMYAELLARRDDPTASDFINMVRNRAGLEDVVLTSANVVELIAQERFVEFFGENGDRLYTLKRLGLADEVLSAKPNSTFIAARNNLWPIPQQEIERNSAISETDQNPGY